MRVSSHNGRTFFVCPDYPKCALHLYAMRVADLYVLLGILHYIRNVMCRVWRGAEFERESNSVMGKRRKKTSVCARVPFVGGGGGGSFPLFCSVCVCVRKISIKGGGWGRKQVALSTFIVLVVVLARRRQKPGTFVFIASSSEREQMVPSLIQ